MIRVARALWLVVSTSVRVDPWRSVLCLTESTGVLMDVLQPLFLAWLVSGAVDRDLRQMTWAAGAFLGSVAADKALCMIGVNARIRQLERVSHVFGARVAEITARIPTLDHLESPRYLDQAQMLRERSGSLGVALNTLLNTFNDVVRVGGTLALAATADWRMLLVATAGLPVLLATRWFVAWQATAEAESAQPGRLTFHLLGLGRDAVAGAEVRVFGLGGFLRERLRLAVVAWRQPFVVLARRMTLVETLCNAVFFGVAGAVLLWMVGDVLAGTVRLDSFVLAMLLVNRLQSGSRDLQEAARTAVDMIRTTMRLLWLLDYAKEVERVHTGTLEPGPTLSRGIELDGVTYRYAPRDRPALDQVSLQLPAGSIVALVGENGAGKTTLVKLLAGMYQPTTGRILVDGVDLNRLDVTAWRRRLSGAFQDYLRPEFLAAEAVGIGDLDHLSNRRRLRTAVEDGAAGAVIAQLPGGLDTQLGSAWPGGVGLSGGQWQRLALARGMMRDHPLLLVLDEPTAALDATTEHALFERYAAAAKAGRASGTVTVVVTHRFSTVSAADLIVVLDHGRVVEIGSHAELLEADGHYAELYRLQARGYA
ncbi:ABC transporter ATP-binding protein [Actinopolymorpha sp. B17G11]|uniref:ABC transporter ATP-binding protein n=1 Tax=Actinopolymorpha sp. B17G11 TaxID=3160861 RepID=UPI0032E509F9